MSCHGACCEPKVIPEPAASKTLGKRIVDE
jgi:hypothetical protein